MAKNKPKATDFLDALAKSGSGACRRLGKGETANVRFLYEVDAEGAPGWRTLSVFFDEEAQRSFYFESDNDAPQGATPRTAFFAVAYDVDTKETNVWEFRKSLVQELNEHRLKYGTITDRNYRLRRMGEGLQTKYRADDGDEQPMSKGMKKAQDKNSSLIEEVLDELLEYAA